MIIVLVDDRTGETDRYEIPAGLAVRVRALLRDGGEPVQRGQIVVGNLYIDQCTRAVTIEGVAVKCTSVEYAILERLARDAGRVVSREALMLSACEREPSPFDRALDVHVSRIRRKLRHSGTEIVTVRGTGYMLAARADP